MAIKPIKTPFTNLSFTPDVPSAALAENEYNIGLNVETDTRSIRSVAGDEEILSAITGNVIHVTSGFRNNDVYWYVTATREGHWYGVNAAGVANLTPTANTYVSTDYTNTSMITDAWNGSILFVNDGVNPPMFLLPDATEFALYSNDDTATEYVWNYNPSYTALRAGFMRLYAAPNVGSILIAGNLQADTTSNTVVNMPTTVRWSQAFGVASGPNTWEPTLLNVANELEIPVRGPVIDGFALNGNFYALSYWDTVVFSPIGYQSGATPSFGVKLLNQGRGLLNENCWCNADDTVFGVDARDIWVFNGGQFASLGNQRVKDYFYANLNPDYYQQVFMINNTSKNQIELYYPDLDSTGLCNRMLAYRYDLKVWQPPRVVSDAVKATEGPSWSANVANTSQRAVVYAQGNTNNSRLVQKDVGNAFLGNTAISTLFQRDNISFGQPYSNKVQVHRVLPEVTGTGNVTYAVGGAGSVGADITFKPNVVTAIDTDYPWAQIDQNDSRVVSIRVSTESVDDSWQLTAMNWQVTVVEDDR